jgi:ATP-binding cassette subfamily B protein
MNFISSKFIQYFKQYPIQTTVNLVLSLTFPIDDIVIPYLIGRIVNSVQNKEEWISKLIIVIIILIVMQILYTFGSWHDAIVLPNIQNFIKHQMMKNIFENFEGTHKEPIIGEIMSRIVKIPLTITYLYEQFKNFILAYFLSFMITGIYIMTIDMKLGIVITICVLIVFIIVLLSPLNCMNATSKQENLLSEIDEQCEDMLRNINSIYINNQTDNELNRLKHYEKQYDNSYFDTMTCTVKTRIIAISVLAIMLGFLAYRSYYGIKNKTLQIGSFVAILLILSNWFSTLGWLIANIRDIVIQWGIVDAYEKILKKQSNDSIILTTKTTIIPPPTGILFSDLTYIIKDKTIIDHLNLYIPLNQRLVIIGDIGSGKSTTLKLLIGLIKPTNGEIYINAVATSSMTLRDLRKQVTYVSQNPILFNRSIRDNIVYGLTNKPDNNYIKKLLYELGLDDMFLDLDALCGKNGSGLSGGQRQIIAIMRAYILNPSIIILDEITSSIDKNTKEKLFKVLEKLFENKTIIIVTHDPDLMKFATLKCEMIKGKLSC